MTWGNEQQFPQNASEPHAFLACIEVTIGASGAATVTGSRGITVVKNATGIYDVTFPKCPVAYVNYVIKRSPAGTVKQIYGLAFSATAGTAQFGTSAGGGVVTEPASGDVLQVWFQVLPRGR